MFQQDNFWKHAPLGSSNAAYLPWIPGSHGNCWWIKPLQEGPGIITSAFKVRRAVSQRGLLSALRCLSRCVEERASTSWLCLGWQLVSLPCYYFKRRNAKLKGTEDDGPLPNCRRFWYLGYEPHLCSAACGARFIHRLQVGEHISAWCSEVESWSDAAVCHSL